MARTHLLVPNMNLLLPSEVARLVLGYLNSTKCTGTRTKFLEECPHLREYVFLLENGQEYPTTIFGRNLIHYLNIGYQYTQYLSACGDSLKYPFGTYFSAYQNRPTGVPFGEPSGRESPAQQGTSVRNGSPLTSPRQPLAADRTPRGGGWPGASPAERDRRSPADSIIDVTTVTEPPSSEPQLPSGTMQSIASSGIVAPSRPVSEASIQTEDLPPVTRKQAQASNELTTNHQHHQPEQSTQQSRQICVVGSPAIAVESASNVCFTPPPNDLQNLSRYQPSVNTPAGVKMPSNCSLNTSTPSTGTQFTTVTVTTETNESESHLIPRTVSSAPQDKVTTALSTVPLASFLSAVSSKPDPLSPPGNDGNDNLETSIGFQPQISLASLAASPKRKTVAPRRRPVAPPIELSIAPPSPPKDSTGSTTRRMFDEFVQNQLAEKLAESINEAAIGLTAGCDSQGQLLSGSSANVIGRPSGTGRSFRPFALHENSQCSNSSALQNDLLDLAISKALADPVVEELAQYMALKTTSGVDLDTPNGTPLKGAALRTPFKQIAEEVASESIVIDDTSALEEPPIPMRSFEKLPVLGSTIADNTLNLAQDSREVVLQPGQCVQLPAGFISVTTSGTLTSLMQQSTVNPGQSGASIPTTKVVSPVVSQSLFTPMVGPSDPTKILIDSSSAKATLPAPPVLQSAPRKPSPKISTSESATLSAFDDRTQSACDQHPTEPSASPQASVASKAFTAPSHSTRTVTTSSFPATSNSSLQPKKASTLGSHIRALDFDGLAACAARYPNLYKNVNIYESTPVSPPRPNHRPGRPRKRKSPNPLCRAPKMARRAATKKSKETDASNEPKHIDSTENAASAPVSSAPVTLSVFNIPTAIVSIPDDVRPSSRSSPSNGPDSVNLSVQNDARQSHTLPEKPKRRQAIMVDVAPIQRRTVPVRISSSRAKPRRGNRMSKDNTDNDVGIETIDNESTNTSNAKFRIPMTPKKFAASNNNSSGNRLSLPLTSIKGRISIGKMQELQEEARRAAKATDTKKPSVVLRHIAPKGDLSGAPIHTQNNKSVIFSTTHLPPLAPKISPTNEKKNLGQLTQPITASAGPNQQKSLEATQLKAVATSQGTEIAENGPVVPLLVKLPASQQTAPRTNIAPFNLDISALLDLVHKSNASDSKTTVQPKI